jgi:arabinofuranan 3-O-arabinosyltransferase
VLVEPSAAFGEYTWGRPLDEPIATASNVRWLSRSIIPLGTVGMTRWIDRIDDELDSARPVPGLAAMLRRAGIRYVLVRADLDPLRTLAPAHRRFAAALQADPDLRLAATFGTIVPPLDPLDAAVAQDRLPEPAPVPAASIYELDGAAPLTVVPAGWPAVD